MTESDWKEQGSTKSVKSNKSVFDAVVRYTAGAASISTLGDSEISDKRKSWCSCCGLVRSRQRKTPEPEFQTTLVLIRHSERLDYVDKNYKQTELGKSFPYDAPLTEQGWKLAEDAAENLTKLYDERISFAAVATSPYRRCVETAVVIAKRLNLPIVLDQEIGEVWEKKMGENPVPWRAPAQLKKLLNDLEVPKVLNPLLGDGGYKLFGKLPQYPETLEKARNRMVVRFETYIRQSEDLKQNFILCTHADGIAAACGMFERGCADVTQIDFCSQIIARRRTSTPGKDAEDMNTFAKKWIVDIKGIETTRVDDEDGAKKVCEMVHNMACEENEEMVASRREKRTGTDEEFDGKLKSLLAATPDTEEMEMVVPEEVSKTDNTVTVDVGDAVPPSLGLRISGGERPSYGKLPKSL